MAEIKEGETWYYSLAGLSHVNKGKIVGLTDKVVTIQTRSPVMFAPPMNDHYRREAIDFVEKIK